MCDFRTRDVLRRKSEMTGGGCAFKFVRRSVDGKHLMRFQRETSVFKFL